MVGKKCSWLVVAAEKVEGNEHGIQCLREGTSYMHLLSLTLTSFLVADDMTKAGALKGAQEKMGDDLNCRRWLLRELMLTVHERKSRVVKGRRCLCQTAVITS